jgi:hypothetical protein
MIPMWTKAKSALKIFLALRIQGLSALSLAHLVLQCDLRKAPFTTVGGPLESLELADG